MGLNITFWVFFLLLPVIAFGSYLQFIVDSLNNFGEITKVLINYFVFVPYMFVASHGVIKAAQEKTGFFISLLMAGTVMGLCVIITLSIMGFFVITTLAVVAEIFGY